jgi:hypothetical protein
MLLGALLLVAGIALVFWGAEGFTGGSPRRRAGLSRARVYNRLTTVQGGSAGERSRRPEVD